VAGEFTLRSRLKLPWPGGAVKSGWSDEASDGTALAAQPQKMRFNRHDPGHGQAIG